MVGIVTAVGVTALSAGFVVYPWGSESRGRTIVASALWIVGSGFMVAAVVMERKRSNAEKPHTAPVVMSGSSEGPSIVAGSIVNKGVIAHTVNTGHGDPPTTPAPEQPAASELREAVHGRLLEAVAEGERIARLPFVERTLAEAPPWQNACYDLLDSALDDPMPAQWFASMGTPIEGQPLNAGLGGRIANQIQYLKEIAANFAMFRIKATWRQK